MQTTIIRKNYMMSNAELCMFTSNLGFVEFNMYTDV